MSPRRKLEPWGVQSLVVLALTVVPLVVHALVPYRFPEDPNCEIGRLQGLAGLAVLGYPVLRLILRLIRGRAEQLWWPANLVLAAYIVVLLVSSFDQMARWGAARAKVHIDQRALIAAVSAYTVRAGRRPEALEDLLTVPAGASGPGAAPVVAALPRPPRGWTPYRYEPRADGTFVISASGPADCKRWTGVNGELRLD